MKHFKVTTTTTIFGLIAVSICSTIEAASAELHGDHENLAETIQKLQVYILDSLLINARDW